MLVPPSRRATGDGRATTMAMAMELLCAFNHPALRPQSNSYCSVLGGSSEVLSAATVSLGERPRGPHRRYPLIKQVPRPHADPTLRPHADPGKSQPSRTQADPGNSNRAAPGRPHQSGQVMVDQRAMERLADFRAKRGTDERNYAGMAQTDKLERTGAQK